MMNAIQSAIKKVVHRENLSEDEMTRVMEDIMNGSVTPEQLAGFLVAMYMKGETVAELAAATKVLRSLAVPVQTSCMPVVDVVGTGGDQVNTFNISTASAFVVAAAGGCVAKQGNRAATSKSGSADVLEAAGINLQLSAEQVSACIDKLGISFMFAPQHHHALRHASLVRKELGIRTFFNLLGPLTNPAGATHQLIGVFDQAWVKPVATVLQELGSQHVLVVHSKDGLDEISIGDETFVAELKQGKIRTYTVTPEQFGFKRSSIAQLEVETVAESLALLTQVLQNVPGPARDIVALNAGAAIYAADLAENLDVGIAKATAILASGAAYEKFQALIKMSQGFS